MDDLATPANAIAAGFIWLMVAIPTVYLCWRIRPNRKENRRG